MGDARFLDRDFVTDFIALYKSLPCLWKIKSKEYTNRNLKNEAHNKLVDFCKSINPAANREFVIKRIQSFRGSFRKELRKVAASKRSGAGTEEIYEPTLWYFNLLLFTLDQEQPTPSLSNMEQIELEQENFQEEATSQEEIAELPEDDVHLEGMNDEQVNLNLLTLNV